MKTQELKFICRMGWVTEILSENQVEITFDTEDGIEKVVYTIPKHRLSEGIKVGERIYLSKIHD